MYLLIEKYSLIKHANKITLLQGLGNLSEPALPGPVRVHGDHDHVQKPGGPGATQVRGYAQVGQQ